MRRILTGISSLALLLGMVFSSAAYAEGSCAYDEEMQALNARVLQTEFMVAALSCSQKAEYNTFAQRFQSELVSNGQALKSYFRRVYGGGSERYLNEFVTRLANDVSTQSLQIPSAIFCSSTQQLFNAALTSNTSLSALTAQPRFAQLHHVRSCNPQPTQVAENQMNYGVPQQPMPR